MKFAGAFYALTLGAITWSITFLLTEYITTSFITTSPELYLFPGIISGIINGFLIVFTMSFYIKRHKVKNWFIETLLIGIVISIFNFVLDYVIISAFSRNPIVLVSYPLYIVFSLFGGYLTIRK